MHDQTQPKLSQAGQDRKQAMLLELQQEVVDHPIRQKRIQVGVGVTSIALLAIAIGFLSRGANIETAPPVASNVPSLTTPVFRFATIEQNRDAIVERYVEHRIESSLSFDRMSDEELVSALKSSGSGLVLAEIDGQQQLIPAKLTP